MLTCEPNRQKACASSHPSGPPPEQANAGGIGPGRTHFHWSDSPSPRFRESKEAWDATAGDESPFEAQPLFVDLDRVGSHKARLPEIHIDTRRAQPMCRDPAADARPHTSHPLHRGRKVNPDAGGHLRAEVFRIAHLSVQAGGATDRLRRYAPDIEARAGERSRSTSATFAPILAALRAVSSPAVPAPTTTKVYLSAGSGFFQSGGRTFNSSLRS